LAGCDRATRLVEQLLTLARLEAAPTTSGTAAVRLDLSALARRIAANLAPTALARHQTLELDAEAPGPVSGDETLIGVLLRNLIDNALRYCPDQAQIWVSVAVESGQTVLRVQDSGAGMTETEMARLGERFFRVLGSEQPGSGLGWSIVKRIAVVFDAQIQVGRSQRLGGLAVTVRWPSPPTGATTTRSTDERLSS
jgi:two-component system sensor histidine kinase QseC